jgi:hypothetical protein
MEWLAEQERAADTASDRLRCPQMSDLQMQKDELLALPVSVDLTTAGRAFGLGRTRAYELARAGQFPAG